MNTVVGGRTKKGRKDIKGKKREGSEGGGKKREGRKGGGRQKKEKKSEERDTGEGT